MKFATVLALAFMVPAAVCAVALIRRCSFYLRGEHTRGRVVDILRRESLEPGDTPGTGFLRHQLVYSFEVGGKRYEAIDSFGLSNPASLGKEMLVIYKRTDPRINRLWHLGYLSRTFAVMIFCLAVAYLAWEYLEL